MDLTENAAHRRPMDLPAIRASKVDLQINVIPTMYGEDFAMRLLARGNKLYDLEQLGMTHDHTGIEHDCRTASGLILITGPTGSGKTATLYASLIKLNDGKRKINTIEDPIEYAIDGLRQSQVNPLIDLVSASCCAVCCGNGRT